MKELEKAAGQVLGKGLGRESWDLSQDRAQVCSYLGLRSTYGGPQCWPLCDLINNIETNLCFYRYVWFVCIPVPWHVQVNQHFLTFTNTKEDLACTAGLRLVHGSATTVLRAGQRTRMGGRNSGPRL